MDGQARSLIEQGLTTPWVPNEGPQALGYLSDADELFFGGSAGGSKTWLLLGLCLTAHTRSLLLRLNATNLQQIKDDIQTLMHPTDHWRSIGYGGSLDTHDGRKVELHGCESPTEARKFQGRAHDLKAWDEAPQFDEFTFRFVNAWNRSTVPGQRCRVVAAGNPPTRPEEEWVLRYWGPWLDPQHANPAEPGELRWFAVLDGKDVEVEGPAPIRWKAEPEPIRPRSRTFIPARLSDNPVLAATGYAATLQGLPEPLRSQLLYGDMAAGRADDDWQLIPTEWIRQSMRAWREAKRPAVKMAAAALDVAMGGDDVACLGKLYGRWVAPLQTWPGAQLPDGPTIMVKVLPSIDDMKVPFLIDIGASAGGSAVTAFQMSFPTLPVRAVNFSYGSEYRDKTGRFQMANLRAEMYWRLREALDPSSGEVLLLPDDRDLLMELVSVRWKPTGSGRVQIESKTDIKKRLGRSTDRADAVAMLALTFRNPNGGWLTPGKDAKPAFDQRPARPMTYGRGSFMGVGGD